MKNEKIEKIGGFKVVESGRLEIGGNPYMIIEFRQNTISVFRQGGLDLWAFPQRTKLFTTSEAREFDKTLNQIWKIRGDI